MATTHHGAALWGGLLALAAAFSGCSSGTTLTVRPTTPIEIDQVPTPALRAHRYRRLLVLAPAAGVVVDQAVETKVAREMSADAFVTKVEATLVREGLEVPALNVEAPASELDDSVSSGAERARMLGERAEAHAVLMIQNIRIVAGEKFFDRDEPSEVDPGLGAQQDGRYVHRQTGDCLYRLSFYEVRMEGRLIDVRTGAVLWVGAGRETTLDTLEASWSATLDGDCGVQEQVPFDYVDTLQAEATLERTLTGLIDRMIEPMARVALAGAPLVAPAGASSASGKETHVQPSTPSSMHDVREKRGN